MMYALGKDSSGFSAMIQMNHNDMRPISFKDNNALDMVKQYLSSKISLNISSDATTEDIIAHVVNELDAIVQDSESANYVAEIEKIANGLSGAIANSYHTLQSNVYNTVVVLKEKINNAIAEDIKLSGIDPANGEPRIESNFTTINWEHLKTLAQEELVINTTKELCGLVSDNLSITNMQYAARKLLRPGFKNIELSSERKEELAVACANANRKMNIDDYREYMSVLLSDTHYKGFVRILSNTIVDTALNVNINKIYSTYYDLVAFTDAISKIDIDLSENTVDAIYNNNKKLNEIMVILAYALLICKKTIFNNTLVINKTTLNGEALAAFEKDGGSIRDIANHVFSFYTDIELPLTGITASVIADKKELVNTTLQEKKDKSIMKLRILKNKSTYRCFHKVLNDYLMNVEESMLPEGVSKKDFYQANYPVIKRVSNTLSNKYENLEDAIYMFIIAIFYTGTVVETLYKYMHNIYASIENANADTIKLADTQVISTLVSEYLVSRFCKTV